MSKQDKIKILSMNSNSVMHKTDLIQANVYLHNPDLVCITETKIDSRFDDNELLGDMYTLFRNDRVLRGGGVIIAMSNNCQFKVLNTVLGPGESITITIQTHAKVVFNSVNMYSPPPRWILYWQFCEYRFPQLNVSPHIRGRLQFSRYWLDHP